MLLTSGLQPHNEYKRRPAFRAGAQVYDPVEAVAMTNEHRLPAKSGWTHSVHFEFGR